MTKPLSNPNLIQLRRHTEGVAVVMPAYCEEENLARTVTDFLTTLGEADVPHVVVVTNDGSTDRTGQILNRLARLYPGRVIPVHHSINQGYGAAVRSGIEAALSRTDLRWILLTDSDGQFRAADTLTFLQVQRSERADAVIGYRQERADPWTVHRPQLFVVLAQPDEACARRWCRVRMATVVLRTAPRARGSRVSGVALPAATTAAPSSAYVTADGELASSVPMA